MSHAVILTGGKQFRVTTGDVVRVPSLAANVGDKVEFPVLALTDGATVRIGAPTVDGATVTATVLNHDRASKIIVFKFKRTKQYKRTQGHRQGYTAVKIESVA